ncbi:MAG: hypothetical protein M3498_03605 [Deinococcota bacterium]|jgi:hypothetical protein|nr:hypothetical protein [Deinococcota bacterium]
MDVISKDILEMLAAKPQEGPCVSIYLPTHPRGEDAEQDPIRLKNLLTDADNQLSEQGLRRDDIDAILEPARALLRDNIAFWQHQGDGLALFLAPGTFHLYRLPVSFDEFSVVTDRFHLKPLLQLLANDGRYYILALSQNELRLLQATRHTVTEVELDNVPESLADALKYDDPEKQLQHHTSGMAGGGGNPRQGGRGPAIFHGHGPEESKKTDILRYFQQIDRGLMEHLKDKRAPMVIAGVDYLHPIYREANSYGHLLEEGAHGNPDGWRMGELREKAWEVVEPHFKRAHEEAMARFGQLAGTGQASRTLREIVPAAGQGRVDTLFVQLGVRRWGVADPAQNEVTVHDERQPGDQDLLDFAAVQTLLNGGTVYAVQPDEIPDGAPIAAVFRY